MSRLRTVAPLLAALAAAPAAGAEITRVSSSGEADRAFDASLEIRWERTSRQASITREFGENQAGPATGAVRDAPELTYTQVSNRFVARLAVGLWRDLELRAELPYVLTDDSTWKTDAASPALSGILQNGVDASGNPCTSAPCPMFPVGATHYAGGALGDLRLGLAWAVQNERKESWGPTWVLSVDVTAPTASRFDPAAGRLTDATWAAPASFSSSSRSAVGRKIWVYDLATAFSRRLGAAEPYVKLHVAIPQRSSATYSNCVHAAELAALSSPQMSSLSTNCSLAAWKDEALARPPLVYGLLLGTELSAWEERASGGRVAIDLRVGAEYVGRARWYNELTPATGKLMATSPYLSMAGRLGVEIQASRHLTLRALGTVQHDLAHFVSGEAQGNAVNEIGVAGPDVNPNFDWRYDVPGRRFRIGDVLEWSVNVSGAVRF